MKKNLVVNGFDPYKVKIIPPFIDVKNEILFDSSKKDVLFVGRIEPDKGIDLLKFLVAYLPEDCRLVIAGDGSKRAQLLKEIEGVGLGSKVSFRGWIDKDQLGRAYRDARVVAFPSLWEEPFGRVGLEAMAAGKPVVAFDVGGVSDWLKSGVNGYLVKRGDFLAFKDKIIQILSDHETAVAMGRAGHEYAISCFKSDCVAEKLENILVSIKKTVIRGS